MGNDLRNLLAAFAIVMSGACGGGSSTPTAPTQVLTVQACVTNRTGTVTLKNNGNRTVDMLWNGSVRGTATPGQTMPEFTVVASGPQYVFESRITNTTIFPCQQLVATPIQCQINPYATCTGF